MKKSTSIIARCVSDENENDENGFSNENENGFSNEICVETTVVVDTLGPARRRTYGLCVTPR